MKESSWAWMGPPGHEWVLLGMNESSWAWMSPPGHEWVLLGMNESFWAWTRVGMDIVIAQSVAMWRDSMQRPSNPPLVTFSMTMLLNILLLIPPTSEPFLLLSPHLYSSLLLHLLLSSLLLILLPSPGPLDACSRWGYTRPRYSPIWVYVAFMPSIMTWPSVASSELWLWPQMTLWPTSGTISDILLWWGMH